MLQMQSLIFCDRDVTYPPIIVTQEEAKKILPFHSPARSLPCQIGTIQSPSSAP
jgi:hypothetical protein